MLGLIINVLFGSQRARELVAYKSYSWVMLRGEVNGQDRKYLGLLQLILPNTESLILAIKQIGWVWASYCYACVDAVIYTFYVFRFDL